MMDRSKLLEELIPERYVAGQLTAEEAAEFEEYLLEHPEVIDELEAARHLRLGLRTLSERRDMPAGLRSARSPRGWWLIAAGIAAAVVGAVFFKLQPAGDSMLATSLEQLSATLRKDEIAGEYLLVRTRGGPVDITLPNARLPVMVSLQSPVDTSNVAHSVGLACSGKTLAIASDVRADANGMLVVFLDPASLSPGDCEFQVETGNSKQLFPVRFVRLPHG
jgi:hypothetical protein